MLIGIGQPDKQAPPVVDQRHAGGQQAATLQIVRREATPAPVVLQFVKRVLAIRTVTVELAQGEDFAVQRRYQGGVFPDLPLAVEDLGETEQRLPGIAAIDQRQWPIELAAQQNHPSLPAPPYSP